MNLNGGLSCRYVFCLLKSRALRGEMNGVVKRVDHRDETSAAPDSHGLPHTRPAKWAIRYQLAIEKCKKVFLPMDRRRMGTLARPV